METINIVNWAVGMYVIVLGSILDDAIYIGLCETALEDLVALKY